MSRSLTATGVAALCAALVAAAGCSDDGRQVRTDQTAAGGAGSGSLNEADLGGPARTKQLQAAVDSYQSYVQGQVSQLRTATTVFTDAVRAGDLAEAKNRYAPSRYAWESIEPIAGLVPAINGRVDGQVDDFTGPEDPRFTGWHRLEYLLWAKGTTDGAVPYANQLDSDLGALQTLIKRVSITPRAMVLGATALVKEIATSKITGTEDRYSHTDLTDFAANLDGSQAVLRTVSGVLQAKDSALYNSLLREFGSVTTLLAKYRTAAGDYRPYTAVSEADKQAMKARLTTLAADWAKVPAALQV